MYSSDQVRGGKKRRTQRKAAFSNEGEWICINEANVSKHLARMVYKHQINARNHLSALPSLPFADTVSLYQPLSLLHISVIPTHL